MAHNIEDGMVHATKGLSFIDWDSLDHEEYDKLIRIISTSNKSLGVQLLFVDDELNNCEQEEEEQGSTNDSEVVEENLDEYEEQKGMVDIKNSVLHPAAPVFQPSIPPPTIMPFPIAVPHWPHADPNMPQAQHQPNPYSYPVPGGYVFHHDPNLVAHNGEATVAFVTLSNGQPAYAFAGHPIPAHHFQPTTLAPSIPPLPTPAAAHLPPQLHLPVSGAVIPTTPSHHPLMFPPHITTTLGQPLPAHIVPPHTVSQHLPPHNQHSTQFIYIPQEIPPTSETENTCVDEVNNEPVIQSLPMEGEESSPPQNSNNAVAIPDNSPNNGLLSEIEFGGPVIFDTEISFTNSSVSEQMPSKSPKDKIKPSSSPVKEMTVNAVPDSPPLAHDKAVENTESTIPASISENKKIVESVHIPVSNSLNSIQSSTTSVHSKTESSNVNETSNINVNSSSHSSNVNVNANPKSPVVNSKPNLDKLNESIDSSAHTKERPPKPIIIDTSSDISPNRTVNTLNVQSKTTPPVASPAPKTWSSLFGKPASQNKPAVSSSEISPNTVLFPPITTNNVGSSANSNVAGGIKNVHYSQEHDRQLEKGKANPFNTSKTLKAVDVRHDPLASKLLAKLSDFPISHIPIIVQPRGLKNGKNICFMNATLQVLMGCPPFIHLFRAFRNLPSRSGGNSSTPVFDALVQFVNSFQNCQRTRQQGPAKSKKGVSYDINVGVPFIPDSLLTVAQHILGLNIGVQHDAEEFLSQILSICNEEVEKIIKMKNMDSLNNNSTTKKGKKMRNGNFHQNGDVYGMNNHIEDGEDDGDESWVQVGPRNHCVETNVNNCGQTPLSAIFAGLSRSCLVREAGKTSDTLDSFFTLKLDIQTDNVHSVRDALLRLNATEDVHDVDGKKVNGHRRMFFEELPPVLIMHLKLFEYSNGGGQKIQKKITFDVDLQIPKEILSRAGKSKYSTPKSRSYKLFGVVNHHGTKMNDGHYTSDVFLPIVNGWLHFDDSDVSISDENTVLHYVDKRMPYLLFYRRMEV